MIKISNILQISNIYKNNKIEKNENNSVKAKTDGLSLSEKARDYQIALNAINKSSDIREAKVDSIMEKISKGDYNISMEEVAEKILR